MDDRVDRETFRTDPSRGLGAAGSALRVCRPQRWRRGSALHRSCAWRAATCRAVKDAGKRVTSLAGAAANDVLLINAHMHTHIACHDLGEFRQSVEHAAAVLTLAPRVSHAEPCASILDPVVASLAESARTLWTMGQLAHALELLRNRVGAADAAVTVRIGSVGILLTAALVQEIARGQSGAQCVLAPDRSEEA